MLNDGQVYQVLNFAFDITERKRAEERLHRENREIALANRLLDVFVKETGNDLYDKALDIMLEAMESRHGVFGYIDEQGDLICPTMSKLFDQCEIAGKCICYTRDKWKGLWSRALLEKKTLYSNKPAAVPKGHMPIRNNMAVPVLFQGNVIGLINLANKDTEYTEKDRDFIEAISNKIAPVLFAWIQKELRENERTRAKEKISRQNAVLDGINRIFREALACDTEEELGRACLKVAEELTRSRFGFINELGPDGLLHTIAISDPGWDLCAMHDKAGHCRPPGNFKVHGLYGRVMLDRKSFFTNDPASHPDSIGTPEGHPSLKAFLGVPLIHGGETIGMMGLGNREGGYRSEDLEAAEALSQAIVQVVMRKRIEERVAHLASFPEMNPSPIIELDPEGHVIYVNSVVRTQFPELPVMGPSHPLLSNWPAISAGFSDGKTSFLFLEAEAGGKAFYQAVYYARQLDVIRIYNADITGRKRAEEELIRLNDELEKRVKERTEDLAKTVASLQHEMDDRKRAEEEIVRLAAAVESAADAIVITEQGAIRYVNPAFEKMTGYSREEVNGRDLHLFDSGRHDETYFIKLRETLKNDGVWTGRLINKKKDGTLYEEECTYAPIRGRSGEILNYMAIKRDVTEKVRLESIAQAVDTMNNIGYIFSGVRHEIGNPVATIAMSLDLLLKKIEELDKQTIVKHLNRCVAEIDKVEYLLRCLRNFNMYEQLEPRNIVLSEFMDKLMALLKDDFEKKGISILAIIEPEDANTYADPRALQQVLLNLLTNAADALIGRVDPKITVSVEKAKVVRIRVEDNGRGIPTNRLQDVFKPFYTTKTHGTGLGLMIVRKMLAKMNGTMEIASIEEKGTAVDISIPAGS
jgi:PAS domain S-box-containing protein